MPDLLFVYGSLRAGSGANGLLASCRFLGTAAVPGALHLMASYPVLTAGPGWVHGELYRLPAGLRGQRVLDALDRYEGVAEGLYRRSVVRVAGAEAWTYRSSDDSINQLVERSTGCKP